MKWNEIKRIMNRNVIYVSNPKSNRKKMKEIKGRSRKKKNQNQYDSPTKSVSEAFVSFEPEKSFHFMWSHNIVPFLFLVFLFFSFFFHFHFGFRMVFPDIRMWWMGLAPHNGMCKTTKWIDKSMITIHHSPFSWQLVNTLNISSHMYLPVRLSPRWDDDYYYSSSLIDEKRMKNTIKIQYTDSEFHFSWTKKKKQLTTIAYAMARMDDATYYIAIDSTKYGTAVDIKWNEYKSKEKRV